MRSLVVALVTLIGSSAHAEVYRCVGADHQATYQDNPCEGKGERRSDLELTATPAPVPKVEPPAQVDAARTRALDERDRANAAADAALQAQGQSTIDDNTVRALQDCMRDQKADETHAGRARYSCDMNTGQKVPLAPPRPDTRKGAP
jgi:hypothetical protein